MLSQVDKGEENNQVKIGKEMDASLKYSEDALKEGLHRARNRNGLFLLLSKLLKRMVRIKPWSTSSASSFCVPTSLPPFCAHCFTWYKDLCKLWKTLSADMFPNMCTAASCLTSTVVWLDWSPTCSYMHDTSVMLVQWAACSLVNKRMSHVHN